MIRLRSFNTESWAAIARIAKYCDRASDPPYGFDEIKPELTNNDVAIPGCHLRYFERHHSPTYIKIVDQWVFC